VRTRETTKAGTKNESNIRQLNLYFATSKREIGGTFYISRHYPQVTSGGDIPSHRVIPQQMWRYCLSYISSAGIIMSVCVCVCVCVSTYLPYNFEPRDRF
jgi:hypothetical protein